MIFSSIFDTANFDLKGIPVSFCCLEEEFMFLGLYKYLELVVIEIFCSP